MARLRGQVMRRVERVLTVMGNHFRYVSVQQRVDGGLRGWTFQRGVGRPLLTTPDVRLVVIILVVLSVPTKFTHIITDEPDCIRSHA